MAQSVITGKVSGSDGQPIAGASINVKGNTTTTITNADGTFTIPAAAGDVLVITNVG